MLPEATDPPSMAVGLLCNSLTDCGVICLYKYLCGPEVMRGDLSS